MEAEHQDFSWQTQPQAAQQVRQSAMGFCDEIAFLADLAAAMQGKTGTRWTDWIDHFQLRDESLLREQLRAVGFVCDADGTATRWWHPGGLFPQYRLVANQRPHLAIKVESVADFLAAHDLDSPIDGTPLAALRTATVAEGPRSLLRVVERHGCRKHSCPQPTADQVLAILRHQEAFRLRRRDFADPLDGFAHARRLIENAHADIETDRTCDLFFAAERQYWQQRNRAAQIQKARQDTLGLGWANHDHHTYRSSREYFAELIAVLESLGFVCRERFYGGAEAGWGAQVLEQAATGIVIFADVDLSPTEVTGDFAHDGLQQQTELGTVGLWCKLHGEAFLQAGMHHLECQFDFDAARRQLAAEGIETMAPFTDFTYLKQAFTVGERWPIGAPRIDRLLATGQITAPQAAEFRERGAIGSHLEILERNQGYKGFNQTGISEIIRDTDPRRAQP
ncbi:hypothetical protein [Roseimaritima ulvae]|uniref:Uncharacterized protein n=1 Tax=Roseimaritima ulvae TaxID=980254 RepID=A0A5B9R5I8_9BACT|nr:hypothetical protein [Roseimaritima ulvae]QEG41781.1 hypothetical protein UC8_38070 [Roseimaritima ulvae]